MEYTKVNSETISSKFEGEGWEEDRNSKSNCGIIYCRTRDGTEEIASAVRKMGITCQAYHAGLKDKERTQVQEDWMKVVTLVAL